MERLGNLAIDMRGRLTCALAEVARFIAVAQLDCFMLSGRRARGHGGAAHRAGLEQHVAFDGRVAAAVEDLSADDVNDGTHSGLLQVSGR